MLGCRASLRRQWSRLRFVGQISLGCTTPTTGLAVFALRDAIALEDAPELRCIMCRSGGAGESYPESGRNVMVILGGRCGWLVDPRNGRRIEVASC